MFRVVSAVVSGALLLALASTFVGRGSLAQFDHTVVPSVWTFAVTAATVAWAFALRGTRDVWVRAGCAGVALVMLTLAPRPTLLVLAAGLAVDLASRRLGSAAPVAVAAAALVALLQLPAFWFGLMLNDGDVAQARNYCQAYVPKLESYYDRMGTYPRSLHELPFEMGEVPRLLDPEVFYEVSGRRYRFSFRDPSGLDQGMCYDSSIGAWRRWAQAGELSLAQRL